MSRVDKHCNYNVPSVTRRDRFAVRNKGPWKKFYNSRSFPTIPLFKILVDYVQEDDTVVALVTIVSYDVYMIKISLDITFTYIVSYLA